MKKLKLFVACLITIFATSCEKPGSQGIGLNYNTLRDGFQTPADSVKPWCYYYWIGDDISKEGLTKDLEAMKEAGIGAALIGNINPDEKDGKVPLFSEKWWEIMVHAVVEGKRLGVDIGIFNCPGWSQSGGPWVKPEMAMRYLTYSETKINGGRNITLQLSKPTAEFQDTYVLAFPSIAAESKRLIADNSTIRIQPSVGNSEKLIDGNNSTATGFPKSVEKFQIDIKSQVSIKARSVKIIPSKDAFKVKCDIYAEVDNSFNLVKSLIIDRSKLSPNVGADQYAPVHIAIPETDAKNFRLAFQALGGTFKSNTYPNAKVDKWQLSEIIISEAAGLDSYAEKSLAKLHPTPFPSFVSYLWDTQPDVVQNDLSISSKEVIDLSDKMDADGNLIWDAPEGEWTIQRYGMTPTGTKNAPAAPQGKGYEIDKMSEELVRFHFDQFVGEFLKRLPEESKSAFKYVIADSYEMGSQNWSDDFQQKFQDKYSYDPKPFLPTYSGRIVQSVDASDRFLWDVRRLVADEVAYEYVGGLRKVSNEHNLQMWLENYGHWGFPSEFLMYGGQSDLVSGEFWNEGTLGDIECKAASSAAHIYGKPRVSAEAFTAAYQSYLRHPALLKKRGDWSFTEGINHFVLHLYIHQPDDNRKPGVNAWFSTEFNRHNTWFEQSKAWMTYLRRNQHMLTQGQYSADVAYFIGENTPIMTGTRNPELPQGYSYDYLNAEVLLNRVTVKNGRLTFPDGMSYGLLVLPPVDNMRPSVLEKIKSLVQAGANIYGAPPTTSPSLENYPESDAQVQTMAAELWGEQTDQPLFRSFGEGHVIDNMSLKEALEKIDLKRDLKLDGDYKILWTHREADNGDIYFITNQSDDVLNISPSFNVQGMKPQLWDAVTGEIRALPVFKETDGYTTVPLSFEKDQSFYIVFSETDLDSKYDSNFPEAQITTSIEGSWEVDFLNKDIGPKGPVTFNTLSDWNQSDSDAIKFYSGTANYSTTFEMGEISPNQIYMIDLGQVSVMGTVTLNGQEVGTTWIYPFQLDVTNQLKQGKNELVVKVANLWRNRLIKDKMLPENERYSWHIVDDIKPNEEPPSAGLLGPVSIKSISKTRQ
ncbi:glycosyl hydrolase [Marinoscillum furvescens]|uniref:Glycosyl hydrolase family 2 n=1 Tax=Marinoscillum furvescens DSM 4134 TaxID=1122208 RepID=A0A3D9L1W9_MARFU|nr:glycosyl hydrolase [Marinoscillum furvescens]RED98363.1 glycosyl hydrolase family 2 [Marinoscillum furvescens DSM 4134]